MGQHSLFQPILQWVPRCTATPLVCRLTLLQRSLLAAAILSSACPSLCLLVTLVDRIETARLSKIFTTNLPRDAMQHIIWGTLTAVLRLPCTGWSRPNTFSRCSNSNISHNSNKWYYWYIHVYHVYDISYLCSPPGCYGAKVGYMFWRCF